jgi:hypothetical protein
LIGAAAVFTSNPYEEGRASSADPLRPVGHTRLVEAVAFSPDGRTLASCGSDHVVRVWDVSRLADEQVGESVVLPRASRPLAIAVSPDSRTLAVGGFQSLTIWARQADEYQIVIDEEGTTYRCLAFSPDGRLLALGGDDHKVRIWDMPSGHERAVLNGHADVVRTVAFSPDSRRLISTGQDRFVMLWDAIDGVAIRPLGLPGSNPVQFGAFSPDGRTVALGESAASPQDITLFDAETRALRTRLTGHLTGINALAFSPDSRTLASAGIDRSIRLWDLATAKEKTCLTADVGWVKSIAFSPDGAWLAFAGNDCFIRIWNLNSQRSICVGTSPKRASAEKRPSFLRRGLVDL